MPTLGEYSEVAICNMALAEIGRGAQITSLDEASQAARACKLRYPYARDAVLRAYDWNFAGRRAEIAKNSVAPAFEYANAYDLPADCLIVRSVFDGEAEKWVVEGRQILTDMGDPIFIKYTGLVTDTAQFDPLFVEALAAYETTQQAILIYGRLPTCDAEAGLVRFCKDREVWTRIKVVEKAATTAIAEATPVLNGAEADAGQLVAALMAIENVKNAVGEAQTKLKGATP